MEEVESEAQEQKCWISDMKFIESGPQGIASFVLYTLNTEFPSGQSATCIRRYSDFEWLQKQLETEFPAVLIPVIPEKEALFRFTQEVVDYRRRELGRFLSRLVAHPKLSESKALDLFLTATRDEFNDTKERSGSVVDKTANFFISNILSTVSNLTNEVHEIDDNFTYTHIYIDTLSETYRILESATEKYNAFKIRMADNVVELNRAIDGLQRLESKKAQNLAELYAKLGETFVTTTTLERAVMKVETEVFADMVKDQARLAEAALRVLHNRQEALKSYQAAQNVTKARQDKQNTQTEALDLAKATENEAEQKKIFESLSKDVNEQIEMYKVMKSKEVRAALREFALKSIECAEQSAASWQELGKIIDSQTK